jgi:hypothetical protein
MQRCARGRAARAAAAGVERARPRRGARGDLGCEPVFGVFQGPRSPALRRPRRGLARGRRASAGAPLSAFTQLVVRRQDQERPSRAGLALFSFLWVGGLVQPGCSVRGRPAYLLEPQHGAGASLLYVEDGTASFLFVGAAAEAGLGSGEQEGRWRSRWRSRAQPPGRAGSAGQEGRTRSLLTLPTLLALDPDVALSFLALSGARVGTQQAFWVNAQGPDRVQLLCSYQSAFNSFLGARERSKSAPSPLRVG